MLVIFLTWQSHLVTGNGYPAAEYDNGGWEGNRGYARGRGRGRGRNFRGRGRGGFNGPAVDTQYDAGGYNQEAPFQGRGIVSKIDYSNLPACVRNQN